MHTETYDSGRRAFHALVTSRQFAPFSPSIPAEEAVQLFLPRLPEAFMQVATPLPKGRQDWLRGFTDAQKEYLQHAHPKPL